MISLKKSSEIAEVISLLRQGNLSVNRLLSIKLIRNTTEKIPKERSEDTNTREAIDYVMYNRYRYIDDIKAYHKKKGIGEF